MRISRNRFGAVGIALALTISVAACGSDSDDASSSPTTSGGSTTAAASTDDSMSPTGPGCASVPKDGAGSFAGMAQDPAATAASNNPLLSTLVTAVGEADLVDTLNGPGPFTIFAPTNDAFAKIPAADLDAVLADKDLLTQILTLHVVSGKMSSSDLAEAGTVTSLEGSDLTIEQDGDALTVNGANVVCQDVPTANATVFIIDSVMMPGAAEGTETSMSPTGDGCAAVPADGDGSFAGMAEDPAATAASNNPLLSTLVTAVGEAGLVDTLNGPGPFTIFAPTNDAFAKIPAADLEAVLADKDLLTQILTLHVVSGKMSSSDLAEAGTVTSLEGSDLTIEQDGDALTVNGANVVCQDVPTANATVFLIDSVMMPS
jgi:uncharacterized surface protein with fasciclin (FAS1) repeats